jgi:hypothetical protein
MEFTFEFLLQLEIFLGACSFLLRLLVFFSLLYHPLTVFAVEMYIDLGAKINLICILRLRRKWDSNTG